MSDESNSDTAKNIKKVEKKILVMGLDNSGKTSIILSLRPDSTILPFHHLKPTYGLKIEGCSDLEEKYFIWDFGGQKKYREEHLETLPHKITDTEKLIYVFDVQDTERYDQGLDYLKRIMDRIADYELEIVIYLHKYDPFLEHEPSHEINEKLRLLIEKIGKIIPENKEYKVFRTCILTHLRKLPS